MLEAAARLFGTNRFHEVRMEDIAAEAEVGKGTLYRYFSDKDELFLALLERSALQLNARVHAAVQEVEGQAEKLLALVAAILQFFDEQPHLFDLIQRAEVLRGPDFPWRQTRDELVKLLKELFAEARDRGEFVIGDPELAALMLLGGLRGVLRFGKQPRAHDLAAQIVATLLHGHDVGELHASRGSQRPRDGAASFAASR